MNNRHAYIGRFAPSPSGPLHLGSLVTAIGSYLQAKSQKGLWHLRIDDIDPPRIMDGAMQSIPQTLESHGLIWDGDIEFQSHQSSHYDAALSTLSEKGRLYACKCTRADVKKMGGRYDNRCREVALPLSGNVWRFTNGATKSAIHDKRLGKVNVSAKDAGEDFIVKRKDGLYAYHLASVVDDIRLGVTEVVRGEDLLLPTACQAALFGALDATLPTCVHLPLVALPDGRKYSKQNHAPDINLTSPQHNIISALTLLEMSVPTMIHTAPPSDIIAWAVENWHPYA